ncbi:hypothetical protein J6590_036803 [Homalodisca vitripennis]|nr:hypothetical protein J6590_036803 [Homalodisca vitripennis]
MRTGTNVANSVESAARRVPEEDRKRGSSAVEGDGSADRPQITASGRQSAGIVTAPVRQSDSVHMQVIPAVRVTDHYSLHCSHSHSSDNSLL